MHVSVHVRFGGGLLEKARSNGTSLAAYPTPVEIICTITDGAIAASQQTSIIPIIFNGVIDPVGSGLVRSLAHPSGNITHAVRQIRGVTEKRPAQALTPGDPEGPEL